MNDEWGKLAKASAVVAAGGAGLGVLVVLVTMQALALLPETFSTRALAALGVVGLLCGAEVGRWAMWFCGFCGEILLIPVTAGAPAAFASGFGLRAPLGLMEEPLALMTVAWMATAIWFGDAFVVVAERWR